LIESDGMLIESDGMLIESDGMLIESDGMLIESCTINFNCHYYSKHTEQKVGTIV